MSTEILLLNAYALLLVTIAHGLIMYGRKTYGPGNSAISHLFDEMDEENERLNIRNWGWPHGDAARFAIGIAAVINAMALFIALIAFVRNSSLLSIGLVLPVVVVASISLKRIYGEFRS